MSPLEIKRLPASWVFKMYQKARFDAEYENQLYLLNKNESR